MAETRVEMGFILNRPQTPAVTWFNSDLTPDVENLILSQMATNLIGFQRLKIRFLVF